MNLLSKPIMIYSVFSILLGALLSLCVSFLLPSSGFSLQDTNIKDKDKTFKINYAFNLKKKEVKKVIKKTIRESSHDFLLKDFSISGILLSDDEKIVLIRDPKGGVFLYLNKSHKGYTLVEVYEKKAKFKKGINYFWAFLNPKDETNYVENTQNNYVTQTKNNTSTIKKTIAKDMFEDIKYKDGKYFIPKSTLKKYTSLDKIFSTISIQIRRSNDDISFRINYLSGNSIFSKLGLRKNDFIIKADNQKFKNVNEPIKYFQNLENLTQLSLTIKRNGQVKELKYEIY